MPETGSANLGVTRSSPEYLQTVQSLTGGKISNLGNAIKYADLLYGLGEYAPESTPKTTLTATQQTELGKISSAEALIDQYSQLLGNIGLQEFGPLARVTGIGKRIAGAVGLAPSVNVYESTKGATIAPIMRAMGEVGVLTDKDREYALKALPSVTDSKKEARLKIAFLKALLNKRKQSISQATDFTPQAQNIIQQVR